ncbi:uncharacterized protein [Aegilops tauschii subsp. strangulata]|uniref:uncharacterized protein n=1 Tax=Aegilops tauschii subsp. strangulata TaxID=200361 RepID=UPI003CC8D722
MASSATTVTFGLSGQVTEKLSNTNFILWRTQITPEIRGAGFFGYIDGTNPELAKQVVIKDKDGRRRPSQIPFTPSGSKKISRLASMFSSQSLSRVNNIRIALANAQKGTQSVATYFAHMRSLADELAAAGKPLQDDSELISYILARLDME